MNDLTVAEVLERINPDERRVMLADNGMVTCSAPTAHNLLLSGCYEMMITPLGEKVRVALIREAQV